MRRVGTAVRTAQGKLVLDASGDPVTIGTELVTADLAVAGRVVEYFGPVGAPYVLVDPDPDIAPAALIGDPLYAR